MQIELGNGSIYELTWKEKVDIKRGVLRVIENQIGVKSVNRTCVDLRRIFDAFVFLEDGQVVGVSVVFSNEEFEHVKKIRQEDYKDLKIKHLVYFMESYDGKDWEIKGVYEIGDRWVKER